MTLVSFATTFSMDIWVALIISFIGILFALAWLWIGARGAKQLHQWRGIYSKCDGELARIVNEVHEKRGLLGKGRPPWHEGVKLPSLALIGWICLIAYALCLGTRSA
jgi:hypothetical protein